LVFGACSTGSPAKPTITIGSDDFYESSVVAEMFAQVLEADGYTVERNLKIGARQVRAPAMESGDIDLAPEYVGSGLGFYDASRVGGDGQANRDALAEILESHGISVFGISPGEDTNATVVRGNTASEFNLRTIGDLAAVEDQLVWGLPAECDENPLCRGALEAYGITYPPAQRETLGACSGPIAEALNGNAIDVGWLCSTQPAIAQFGFVVLEDDKNTQPAENMTALVRDEFLQQVDDVAAFQAKLDAVLAALTTDELTKLGLEIVVNVRDEDEVATEFLQAKGLLPR
jgi:osmoprotectant transport system substrate-binding protein